MPGTNEIDLLGVQFLSDEMRRFHVESSVSISGGFSRLTTDPFDPVEYKIPVKKAKLRRSIYYFIERKFSLPTIVDKLATFGFHQGNYQKVIVSWDWTSAAASVAKAQDIELLDFRQILRELKSMCEKTKVYFTDDTVRTIQLFVRSKPEELLPPKEPPLD